MHGVISLNHPPRKRVSTEYVPKVLVVCDGCGDKFLRPLEVQRKRLKHQRQTKNFHNKACQGAWMGRTQVKGNRLGPKPKWWDGVEWQGPYELPGATGWIG